MDPPIVFALVLSSLYGLVFYMIFGHGWLRLVFYWLISVLGFFLGQGIARLVGVGVLNIGQVNLIEGTLVSWLGLFALRAWRGR